MSDTLSSERLDALLHGALTREPSEAAEAELWRAGLADLRLAASTHATDEFRRAKRPASLRGLRGWAIGVSLAAAALALVTGFPALQRHTPATATSQSVRAVAKPDASDDALLNGIRNDLVTTVPVAMRPLAGSSADAMPTPYIERKTN